MSKRCVRISKRLSLPGKSFARIKKRRAGKALCHQEKIKMITLPVRVAVVEQTGKTLPAHRVAQGLVPIVVEAVDKLE